MSISNSLKVMAPLALILWLFYFCISHILFNFDCSNRCANAGYGFGTTKDDQCFCNTALKKVDP